MRGKIIVFDGLDASGKKTQAELLQQRLIKQGFSAEIFHFPQYEEFFGSLVAKYLNGDFGKKEALSKEFVALLYAIDRYSIKKKIEHHLSQGKAIIMDRYSESNFAFQSASFEGKEKKEFIEWIKKTESRLPHSDIVFFLDMPREAAEQLMQSRDREKDQHEKDSIFLDRVRKTYLELSKSEKNWHVIPCAKKFGNDWNIKSIEEIHEIIWKKLSKLLVLNYTLKEIAEQKAK